MAAPGPVPNKAAYWSVMVEWAGYVSAWLGTNAGSGLGQVYYDGQLCAYRVRDYTGDSQWDAFVQRAWSEYVPNYVIASNGGIQGYRQFTDGPLEDVLRGTSRSAQSLTAFQQILANGSFVAAGDMTDQALSRETALALVTHVNYARAGGTLSTAQAARREALLTYAVGHCDQWAKTFTASFFRPFMGAHTAKALIHYFEHVAPDARILPALANLAAYTRSACWRAAAGSWGAGQSFSYTDRDTAQFPAGDPAYNTGGTETALDLNIFVCPYFGWLWKQTGDAKYRTWGDEAWVAGIPVYTGSAWTSGAYLGSRSAANPNGKQFNQQLYMGPRYIEWGEAEPVTTPGGGTVTPPTTPVTGGGGGGAYQSLRVSRRLVSY